MFTEQRRLTSEDVKCGEQTTMRQEISTQHLSFYNRPDEFPFSSFSTSFGGITAIKYKVSCEHQVLGRTLVIRLHSWYSFERGGGGQRQTLLTQQSQPKDRGTVAEEEMREIDLTRSDTSPSLSPTLRSPFTFPLPHPHPPPAHT